MSYFLSLVVLILLYAVVGYGFNLLAGYTGALSLGHTAFLGVGAYTQALLSTHYNWPFLISLAFCALIGGAFALGVGKLVERLRGDNFVLATLAVHFITYSVFQNWTAVTKGPHGVRDIPTPEFIVFSVDSKAGLASLMLVAAFFVFLIIRRIVTLPFGRTLQAIRDDEVAAITLGKDTGSFRLRAFALSGMVVSAGGGLYVATVSFIDPSSFTLDEAIIMVLVVAVGGSGSLGGPPLGSAVVVLLPEILRLLPLSSSSVASARQVIFGVLLILVMRMRPQGIVGRYDYSSG